MRQLLVIVVAVGLLGCQQKQSTPTSSAAPAGASAATVAKPDSHSQTERLPFPTWSEFKEENNFDTTGPLERRMIWQVYRDRVVPAVAAHQGLDAAELQRYFESKVPRPFEPAYAIRPTPRSFSGYDCTQDCSGHEAGYAWAEENGITDPDDCSGKSTSFIEGCQAYAEEQQEGETDE
ncbi:hypothetical protein [Cupriavidus numazuensis]|uniref:Lipoprotein n=1 Tax=Cupriavidus numazuensis TaxID=221992 RepID=A0ABM8TB66_9BURK|nr:hypothetical protein [Cupriavidus numazuensis]CAG2132296.1 hypothetical protein LMG26411_00591 [Cupriavidus numazuensis]